MGFFILLFLTVFSDAMVVDEKVKASSALATASATCSYSAHCKDHPKYWCRGYFRDYCTVIAVMPNSTDRVALRDTGSQLIVTVSCLTKEDAGWYWCGIRRAFARDDMDSTELVVTDHRGGLARDFWSGKDLSGNETRSCRASRVVHKADRSRVSILVICILITGLGIISIISHLSKRRRSQRHRRCKIFARSQETSQASSMIPIHLLSFGAASEKPKSSRPPCGGSANLSRGHEIEDPNVILPRSFYSYIHSSFNAQGPC